MIPDASDAEIARIPSRAEQTVFRELRKLADEYYVFYSLPTLDGDGEHPARDGEADFVIVEPAGVLVIEVKGGGVSFDPTTGDWHSRNASGKQHRIKDPFKQASDRKFDIVRYLGRAGIRRDALPVVGHAVLFPDLDALSSIVAPGRPAAIVGGRKAVVSLTSWVEDAFAFYRGDARHAEQLPPATVRKITEELARPFVIDPKLGARFDLEDSQRSTLTEAQWRSLRAIRHQPRCAVAGGAGTGKTLLATRRAQELARDGKKTLLLCFNQALAEVLKEDVQRLAKENQVAEGLLQPMSFHQFCSWWAREAGRQLQKDFFAEARREHPDGDMFDVIMPYAAALAITECRPKYDAIIIDEAQDFSDSFWLPIHMLAEGALLTVFFDPNQAIFRQSSEPLLDIERANVLVENCRNTAQIHRAAYQHYRGPEVDPPPIDGVPIEVVECSEHGAAEREIAIRVNRWVVNEGIAGHEVAVLVADSFAKHEAIEAVSRLLTEKGVKHVTSKRATLNHVVVDTVARFKGLDASAVIVWLNTEMDPVESRKLLYVAFSRPRSMLVVVGTAAACGRALGTLESN